MKVAKNEPVLTATVAFVIAAIAVLVAFGIHVTDEQKQALVGLSIAAFVLAGVVRSRVKPVK